MGISYTTWTHRCWKRWRLGGLLGSKKKRPPDWSTHVWFEHVKPFYQIITWKIHDVTHFIQLVTYRVAIILMDTVGHKWPDKIMSFPLPQQPSLPGFPLKTASLRRDFRVTLRVSWVATRASWPNVLMDIGGPPLPAAMTWQAAAWR